LVSRFRSAEERRFRSLSVNGKRITRTPFHIIESIVERLLRGEAANAIINAKDPKADEYYGYQVGQKVVYPIQTLLLTGQLNYILDKSDKTLSEMVVTSAAPVKVTHEQFRKNNRGMVDDFLKSRQDAFTKTRFRIAERFEAMAPEKYFTLKHLRSIGMDDTEAVDLMVRYDELRSYRDRADRSPQRFDSVTGEKYGELHGEMAHFPRFREYLRVLFDVYIRTEYPEIPTRYRYHSRELQITGEMDSDIHMVIAGQDILRYRIWESNVAENAYYKSLRRLKVTGKEHAEFVEQLKNLFYSRL